MENNFTISGTDLILHLPVEVDHHNAQELKQTADSLMQKNPIRCIVFDFSRTVFMDSSGIGMIMGRYKNLRFMGGIVVAVGVNERIRRILTMSGIYKVMDIYEDFPETLGCMKGDRA